MASDTLNFPSVSELISIASTKTGEGLLEKYEEHRAKVDVTVHKLGIEMRRIASEGKRSMMVDPNDPAFGEDSFLVGEALKVIKKKGYGVQSASKRGNATTAYCVWW